MSAFGQHSAFSLIYLISPLDIAIPVVDDAFVLWLANTLFVELAPDEVVQEHRNYLENEAKPKQSSKTHIDDNDVINADYKEK